MKPKSYASGDKIWLNSNYIKTKQNKKLETKFFRPFWVLHPVGKQAYKQELPKRRRIYKVFHVSLLEQNTTKKGRVHKNATELDIGSNNKEYKVEAIWDSGVYANKLADDHLPGLYYPVFWNGYSEEQNI